MVTFNDGNTYIINIEQGAEPMLERRKEELKRHKDRTAKLRKQLESGMVIFEGQGKLTYPLKLFSKEVPLDGRSVGITTKDSVNFRLVFKQGADKYRIMLYLAECSIPTKSAKSVDSIRLRNQPATIYRKEVDAMLKKKENIFACKYQFMGYDGKTHCICYDDKGNKLFDETYDVLIELGFSEEQINQIKENYKSGCVSKIKYSEIPSSVVTQFILKSELFNEQDICVNVDNSVYSWNYNNHNYCYSISSTTGGGNFRGTYWQLNVEPYTTDGINSDKYPFLSCEDFSASKYHAWGISVNKEGDMLKIVVDNIRPPYGSNDLDEEGLDKLSRDFTTCDASYYY